MENLEKAKKIQMEINYCIKNNSFGRHYKDFIEQAKECLNETKWEYDSYKREHCDICDEEECPTCKPEFKELREAIKICEEIIKNGK